jgi:hypothetical protein
MCESMICLLVSSSLLLSSSVGSLVSQLQRSHYSALQQTITMRYCYRNYATTTQVVRRELCSVLSRGTRTYCFLDSLLTAPDGSPASAAWVLAIVELPLAAATTATTSAATGNDTHCSMLTAYIQSIVHVALLSVCYSVHTVVGAVAVLLLRHCVLPQAVQAPQAVVVRKT